MSRGEHGWFQKISWQKAEEIFGGRLDRRRQYYIHTESGRTVTNPFAFNGSDITPHATLLTYSEHSEPCSGCTPSYEEAGYLPTKGFGCAECGHTGVRIHGMHVPFDVKPKKESNEHKGSN